MHPSWNKVAWRRGCVDMKGAYKLNPCECSGVHHKKSSCFLMRASVHHFLGYSIPAMHGVDLGLAGCR